MMRYKSFLLGCFFAVFIFFAIGYVRMKSEDVPANVLFGEISIMEAKDEVLPGSGDNLYLVYGDKSIATFSFGDGFSFQYAMFGTSDPEGEKKYDSVYDDRLIAGRSSYDLFLANKNNKCVYFDLDRNGTFDKKYITSKKSSEIWLNNSWVSATTEKTATQMRVGSRLYEFNRLSGAWEVVDDEN